MHLKINSMHCLTFNRTASWDTKTRKKLNFIMSNIAFYIAKLLYKCLSVCWLVCKLFSLYSLCTTFYRPSVDLNLIYIYQIAVLYLAYRVFTKKEGYENEKFISENS